MNRFALMPLERTGWHALLFHAVGLLPSSIFFDREKSINIQYCQHEHARRGFPLRAQMADIFAKIKEIVKGCKNISYALMDADSGILLREKSRAQDPFS